jgi:hypothetical protein
VTPLVAAEQLERTFETPAQHGPPLTKMSFNVTVFLVPSVLLVSCHVVAAISLHVTSDHDCLFPAIFASKPLDNAEQLVAPLAVLVVGFQSDETLQNDRSVEVPEV